MQPTKLNSFNVQILNCQYLTSAWHSQREVTFVLSWLSLRKIFLVQTILNRPDVGSSAGFVLWTGVSAPDVTPVVRSVLLTGANTVVLSAANNN